MTKEIWLNLPVKDINKTKEFFEKIGFTPNEQYSNAEMACFIIGEKAMNVLFVGEDTFRGFAKCEIADSRQGSEVLISFDAESREEIDETASTVFEAGGTIFSEPAEIQGGMYGFAFADLDGHRWNMLFMNLSSEPK